MIFFNDPELGPGWSPAVFETFQEIDFIRAAERLQKSDADFARPYWIKGTVDLSPETIVGERRHCNATASGNLIIFLMDKSVTQKCKNHKKTVSRNSAQENNDQNGIEI